MDLRRQAPRGAEAPAAGHPTGPHAGRHAHCGPRQGWRCPGARVRKQEPSALSPPSRSLSGPSPGPWARQ